jgi:hypothetical protein
MSPCRARDAVLAATTRWSPTVCPRPSASAPCARPRVPLQRPRAAVHSRADHPWVPALRGAAATRHLTFRPRGLSPPRRLAPRRRPGSLRGRRAGACTEPRAAGVFRPAPAPGVRRVSGFDRSASAIPAPLPPLEEFPSPTAAAASPRPRALSSSPASRRAPLRALIHRRVRCRRVLWPASVARSFLGFWSPEPWPIGRADRAWEAARAGACVPSPTREDSTSKS